VVELWVLAMRNGEADPKQSAEIWRNSELFLLKRQSKRLPLCKIANE
jgi:hypothetical protein